jgi:formylmethanofuran dehydrogenase subunit E
MTIAETLRELIESGNQKAITLVMELVSTIRIIDMTPEQILVLRELLNRESTTTWPRKCKECGEWIQLRDAKGSKAMFLCPHCEHPLSSGE